MPSLGVGELLMVAAVLLLFVGPERLPHATRWMGRMYGQVRRAADEMRRALVLEADRMDDETRIKELRRRRVEAEAERKEREAEVDEGAMSQPTSLDEVVKEAEKAPTKLPPGFTQGEWDELPAHIRELVERRGAPDE